MKRSAGIIVALIWLAFALRVLSLSSQSVWWDEAFTWQATSHGWDNLWHMLLTGDRNPPVYFVLTALWGGAAGWSEFSLRFVPLACGLIGVAFLSVLARRLFGRQAGLWALLIGSVAPAVVVYSQEARMYALFFALTAATLYFGLRILDFGLSNRQSVGLFLGCEAALLLTHYFALPIVAAFNLLVVIVWLRRHARLNLYVRWFGGQILAVLPLLIWTLSIFATPGSLINAQESPPAALAFLRQVAALWMSGTRDLPGDDWLALIAALLLVLLALIGAGRKSAVSTRWLAAFGIFSLVPAYALTHVVTSFHPRYLLPYVIPWYILAGGALSGLSDDLQRLKSGHRRLAALAGLALGGVTAALVIGTLDAGWQIAAQPSNAKDDARGVAAYLKANATADDVILVEANDYTLAYYDHGLAQTKMITATTESDAFRQLSTAIGGAKRVWLPHWKVSTQDPRGYWPFLLEQSGALQDWASYRGYELYRYEIQTALRQPVVDPLPQSAADSPLRTWSGVQGQGNDDALTFALDWQPPVKLYDAAGVSIRLLDAHNEAISSVDHPLLDEHGRTTDQWPTNQAVVNYYVLPVPPGTPPLIYTVTAQLYTGRDELAVRVLDTVQLSRRSNDADPYRTLGGYQWWVPKSGDALPGLVLETVSQSAARSGVPPLGNVDVTLRWRKTGNASNVAPRLRLIQNGRVWADISSFLFEHDYPFDRWTFGEMVIDRLPFTYPPLRGEAQLQVGQGDEWTTLTTLKLDESQLMFNLPSMQHAQSAQFGDLAELLGYDLKATSIAPNRPLDLTLDWRATNTEPITTPYTIFTQLIAPDGHLVAQHDAPPNPPTPAWVQGQIVIDPHALSVVDVTYHGPAALIVGWYNSASVVRVPVSTGGDFVALTTPVEVQDR